MWLINSSIGRKVVMGGHSPTLSYFGDCTSAATPLSPVHLVVQVVYRLVGKLPDEPLAAELHLVKL